MEGFIGLGIIENVEKEIKTLKAKQEHTSLKIIWSSGSFTRSKILYRSIELIEMRRKLIK